VEGDFEILLFCKYDDSEIDDAKIVPSEVIIDNKNVEYLFFHPYFTFSCDKLVSRMLDLKRLDTKLHKTLRIHIHISWI
jgi:hypothetical protein